MKPKYFLIMSGNRCGSTWLEGMLNALPDVVADYEMQWVTEPPSPYPLHVAMKRDGFSVKATLDALPGDKPIRGSKLVVPPKAKLSQQDFDELMQQIGSDIRIIHLSRPYIESYLSRLRDGGHLKNPVGHGAPKEMSFCLVPEFREKVFTEGQKLVLSEETVREDLGIREKHDRLMSLFANQHWPYVHIDYAEIAMRFRELARFVGSSASEEQIAAILERPPNQRLPSINYADYIDGLERIADIGREYEDRRVDFFARRDDVARQM